MFYSIDRWHYNTLYTNSPFRHQAARASGVLLTLRWKTCYFPGYKRICLKACLAAVVDSIKFYIIQQLRSFLPLCALPSTTPSRTFTNRLYVLSQFTILFFPVFPIVYKIFLFSFIPFRTLSSSIIKFQMSIKSTLILSTSRSPFHTIKYTIPNLSLTSSSILNNFTIQPTLIFLEFLLGHCYPLFECTPCLLLPNA